VLAGLTVIFENNPLLVQLRLIDPMFEAFTKTMLISGFVFSLMLWISDFEIPEALWILHFIGCLVFLGATWLWWIAGISFALPIAVFSLLTLLYLLE
jgi:hypothetical protein